jgi:histone-lysine N-methyltransferase SETMAR
MGSRKVPGIPLLIPFFDIDGLVHPEFVPPGQGVTGNFYVQLSQRLRDIQGQWFLHHDNAPSHISHVVQQFLAQKNIPVIAQPPYSPDFTPSDFWVFPTLKMGHKGPELRKVLKEAFGRCCQQ